MRMEHGALPARKNQSLHGTLPSAAAPASASSPPAAPPPPWRTAPTCMAEGVGGEQQHERGCSERRQRRRQWWRSSRARSDAALSSGLQRSALYVARSRAPDVGGALCALAPRRRLRLRGVGARMTQEHELGVSMTAPWLAARLLFAPWGSLRGQAGSCGAWVPLSGQPAAPPVPCACPGSQIMVTKGAAVQTAIHSVTRHTWTPTARGGKKGRRRGDAQRAVRQDKHVGHVTAASARSHCRVQEASRVEACRLMQRGCRKRPALEPQGR